MAQTADSTAEAVRVAGRSTPMVLSVARCLREGLQRGARVRTDGATRTVALVSAVDAQRVHVTFSDTELVVAADATSAADHTWQVRWSDPVPAEDGADTFAKEVRLLLSGRDVDWRAAADGFWARAGAASGMPKSFHVLCADDGETVLGDRPSDGQPLQGVMGTAGVLTAFFEGRSTLVEALESGEFGINVSFPVFSALFGASMKVVCGEL